MQNDSERWLRVLGLTPGASSETIRQAYHDLVKVWHPDRFGTDPRLRQKAEEKLREVNAAYDYLLKGGTASSDRQGQAPRPSGPTSGFRRPSPLPNTTSTTLASAAVLLTVAGALLVWLFLPAARHVVGDVPGPSAPIEWPTKPPSPRQPVARQPDTAPAVNEAPATESTTTTPAPPTTATTGSLIVQSQPTGAQISFDGEPVGTTPLTITDITPGEHKVDLDLQARGFKPWSSSIVISGGREEKLLAVMTPVSPAR